MAVDTSRALLFPLLALCQAIVVAQEGPLISRTEEVVEAEPVERGLPDYPQRELRRGAEGWVAMSFMVSETGEVTDAMVESSSGGEGFERAALEALRKWRYRPAQVYGQAVESSLDTVIYFALGSGDPLRPPRKVVQSYKDLEAAMAAHDLPKADALLTELRARQDRKIYEEAWLNWFESVYLEVTKGDAEEQRERLRAAIGFDKKRTYLDPETYVVGLARLFALDIRAGDVGGALDAYERLTSDEAAQRADRYATIQAMLEAAVREIEQVVAGDGTLSFRGQIGEHDFWVHRLVRRSFSIANIEGSLEELSVRCPHRRVTFTPLTGEQTWTVPASYGTCRVFVKGGQGTTFELYEFPDASAEPATALPAPLVPLD
jgi:TonB family protein